MSGPVLVIDLNERDVECSACGARFAMPRVGGQGLPWRDGDIVDADDAGEWAGMDACAACVRAYNAGGPAEVWKRIARSSRGRE